MRLLVFVIFALAIHLLLGWAWTILAGVAAGAWIVRRGWLFGALAVGMDWLILVIYNFIVAQREVAAMVVTMGGIAGNLPGSAIVAITLFIGMLLGALGGLIGSNFMQVYRKTAKSRIPV